MATPAKPVEFDTQLLAEDMALKGWHKHELAQRAGIGDATVIRFLRGDLQTAVTAAKIARALRKPISRYLIRRDSERVA